MIVWHEHHIIPRHMGGTDNKSNLLKCNIALHSFLHKLLWEEHGHWEDEIAYKALSGQIDKAELNNEIRSKRMIGNKLFLGLNHSEETKQKQSDAKKGKKFNAAHKQALSDNWRKNYTKEEISEMQKNSVKYSTCNICGKYTTKAHITRFHNDKCKHKVIN